MLQSKAGVVNKDYLAQNLSDRCFKCHGPDEKARKGRLRLDTPEGARTPLGRNADRYPIIPGNPDQSQVWQRLVADDPNDQMPPPDTGLSLTPEERLRIRRWIGEGAPYSTHWAFSPIQTPDPPAAESFPASHPIDAFIQHRLSTTGLTPAPEAPREQLIRRLALDLTGLPPSLEEVDAFLEDTSPNAYPDLVRRFLESTAYGEQRAAEWLDLARFADTYGYQNDVERDMSPWRDWVIRAFNANLPYDQFVLWQLAGDLLPDPSQDQLLATAFNRLHRQTNEGGSIDEELRTEYAADRVQTFGTAFLGLTLDCARCHDHKYDPVSQRDYYRLFAFFNNIDESGLYSHFTAATPTPTLPLYPPDTELHHQTLLEQLRQQEGEQHVITSDDSGRFNEWLFSQPHHVAPPTPAVVFNFDSVETNQSPAALGQAAPAILIDAPTVVTHPNGNTLRFSGDNAVVLKGSGQFNRTSPFSFSLRLRPAESHPRAVIFHRSRAWTDSGSRGYELVLDQGRPAFALIHFWPGNALMVRATNPLPSHQWTHLTITYDGSSRAEGLRLYANGQPLETTIVRDSLTRDILHRKEWGDADADQIELTLGSRFRDSGFRNGELDDFSIFEECLTELEVALLHPTRAPVPPSLDQLARWFFQRVDPIKTASLEGVSRLRAEENQLFNDVPEIMVMRERSDRRPTHLLHRGAYDAPGDPVEPGTPAALPPLDPPQPPNRLGLTRWLLDPRNPLTARVAVNRVWQTHFGRGLVPTPEDFGSQGTPPSHPELLDWLASWFIANHWDLKGLHQLIVTSSTYRQSSVTTPEALSRDPDNILLARGPAHRLAAEQIRDSALAISGLLHRQVGGPSVRPYQPPGLWEEAGTGKTYTQDQGHALHRRSLYTFWKRTAPPPNLLTFDATTREVCIARRHPTTTPLQALVLLNDPQFIEAAQVLAKQLLLAHPDDPDIRIVTAFRLATGRQPSPKERAILLDLYHHGLTAFQTNPEHASQFVAAGASMPITRLARDQLAATTLVANTVMNLDEFVMKR
jgi:hypothetical protein